MKWILTALFGLMCWPTWSQDFEVQRQKMVTSQIEARGVKNAQVLKAMGKVPRHHFVPKSMQKMAYTDRPLPIGEEQTISQPYIVAVMTELLQLQPDARVLEIGTGSGYQAAVLAELVKDVYSIEIIPELAARAKSVLHDLQYDQIHLRTGNGYLGWPEAAPFDGIIVTAAPEQVPQPLLDQLKPGGIMVIPVGEQGKVQQLKVITKKADGSLQETSAFAVRFVPMTGKP